MKLKMVTWVDNMYLKGTLWTHENQKTQKQALPDIKMPRKLYTVGIDASIAWRHRITNLEGNQPLKLWSDVKVRKRLDPQKSDKNQARKGSKKSYRNHKASKLRRRLEMQSSSPSRKPF